MSPYDVGYRLVRPHTLQCAAPFPPICPFTCGRLQLIHGFIGQPHAPPQRVSAVFACYTVANDQQRSPHKTSCTNSRYRYTADAEMSLTITILFRSPLSRVVVVVVVVVVDIDAQAARDEIRFIVIKGRWPLTHHIHSISITAKYIKYTWANVQFCNIS